MKTKFYEFSQNNSGGSFEVDEKVCHRLMIEAVSEEEACGIAENLGVYFDGCDKGMDCDCCGDRWYTPSEHEFPHNYGSFEVSEAEALAKEYSLEIVDSKHGFGKDKQKKDIVFTTPESYMQYLANNYGWTKPDGRVFYKDGKIVDIFSTKKV